MKRNALTLVVGVILLIIFFLLLFTFQVRQTEMVILTTFDRPSTEPITKPGLYFKWPRPIQRAYSFDKRVHNFDDEFEQLLTRDGNNILASVYVGWTIQRPLDFFNSFPAATPQAAESILKSLVRSTKQAVIGQHPFSDFVSMQGNGSQLAQIEQQILSGVQNAASEKYGIQVEFLRFKRLGLPEAVTQKVFDRMTAERQREIERIQSEGEGEAMQIRSAADRDRAAILAQAQAEAITIRGDAEAEATKHFEVFKQNPELAVYLLQLRAFETSLTNGATLVLDPRTPPFNMLLAPTNIGSATPSQGVGSAPVGSENSARN